MKTKIVVFFFFFSSILLGQTKVGGKVVDEFGDPVAFANVLFKIQKKVLSQMRMGIFILNLKKIIPL